MDALGKRIRPLEPDLLIVDPWYKLYPEGHDENSAGSAAMLLAQVDKLAEELGSAVWICHHDTKMGTELKATARGAGSGLVDSQVIDVRTRKAYGDADRLVISLERI